MSLKKVFITLKSGKPITRQYQRTESLAYKLELSFKEGVFKMYSCIKDEEETVDDDSYKDESHLESEDFNEFIMLIQAKFPNVDI